MSLSQEIVEMRKAAGLTQAQLARRAGVGLRFIRELEQGKPTVRLDKVCQVLDLFGCQLTTRKAP
ncbi:MAG: helix-turn-helix transcriptional regulator [Planctomycetota bacterium]|nr:helix-turn-helix transcriptional regulator [Planctomycetota bacterium]